MTCSACDYARTENPDSSYFRNACPQCAARCLATSDVYRRRNDDEKGKAAYLEALRKLEIAESAKAAHAHVEAWAAICSKTHKRTTTP